MFKSTFILNKSIVFRLSISSSIRSIHSSTKSIDGDDHQSKNAITTVFSGIQPTGQIHLGNYFGAIDVWRQLIQRPRTKCIFALVDLHSITVKHDPKQLQRNIHEQLACLIASGVDPEKCVLFRQSDVNQHGQLAWILGCQLTLTKLNCLPQFKEKTADLKEAPLGLYLYPVLQAADILLYKANQVPVGDDQTAHIFLSQTLSRKFNHRYGPTFPIPEQLSASGAARIKSLRNTNKKMSKSDPDPKSRICLLDEEDDIRTKAKKAITDFDSKVTYEPERREAVSNLILLEHLVTNRSIDSIVEQSQNITTAEYKLHLADVLIDHLRPIRLKANQLLKDSIYLEQLLEQGAQRATELAEQTMNEVRHKIGFCS